MSNPLKADVYHCLYLLRLALVLNVAIHSRPFNIAFKAVFNSFEKMFSMLRIYILGFILASFSCSAQQVKTTKLDTLMMAGAKVKPECSDTYTLNSSEAWRDGLLNLIRTNVGEIDFSKYDMDDCSIFMMVRVSVNCKGDVGNWLVYISSQEYIPLCKYELVKEVYAKLQQINKYTADFDAVPDLDINIRVNSTGFKVR